MKELNEYNPGEFDTSRRKDLMLLACDESSIKCESLLSLLEVIKLGGLPVMLAMPDAQYQLGLRGYAKARILAAMADDVKGVIPLNFKEMQDEICKDWGKVKVPAPLFWSRSEIISSEARKVDLPIIEATLDPADVMLMNRVRSLVIGSNCWLDPASCAWERGGKVLVEGASTNYNKFACTSIPIRFTELGLKSGERMIFCDSLHAERVTISEAALKGITLQGARMIVDKYPCRACGESAIAAGVREVIFERDSYGLVEVGDLFLKKQGDGKKGCKLVSYVKK